MTSEARMVETIVLVCMAEYLIVFALNKCIYSRLQETQFVFRIGDNERHGRIYSQNMTEDEPTKKTLSTSVYGLAFFSRWARLIDATC